MRRGKLSPAALVSLLFVAFFTLCSFVFDQLVIQTEDKIRKLNYEYEKNFNLYTDSTIVMRTTNRVAVRAIAKERGFNSRAEILQDAIMAIKFDKEYFKNHFDEDFDSDYQKNLSVIFTTRYGSMYLDLFEEARISFDLIRGLPIRGMNKDIFEKENSEVLENIMTYTNVMTNVRDEQWKIYKNSLRPYEIITKDDYLTYRKNFNDFLTIYNNATSNIWNINRIHSEYMNYYFKKARDVLGKKNNQQNKRNIFILLSVLTQILSLFSLIILFKIILNTFDTKGKV